MLQIRPLTDFKNIVELSDACHSINEPIFITKNGDKDMVVMSIETYEQTKEYYKANDTIAEAKAVYQVQEISSDSTDTLTSPSFKGDQSGQRFSDQRTERINGIIYNMAPSADYRHGAINLNIYSILRHKLRGSFCMAFCENLDFILDDKGNYAIPDVMIICDRSQLNKGQYYGVPKFIVETLSPGTAPRDRQEKKDLYAQKGVEEYWIIDPFSHSLEIYYLNGKSYVLHFTAMLDSDSQSESYNANHKISLRAFPNVCMTPAEIFEDVIFLNSSV